MSSFGRPRVSRLVFLPALMLMALVGAANRCDAQGANHAGGTGGDADPMRFGETGSRDPRLQQHHQR